MSTKTNVLRKIMLASSLSSATLLAACGGGGGGGGSSSPVATASAPVPAASQPVTGNGTLASPQYAAGSPELAAFNQINAMRQQCGFPAVKENTLLDKAANNHYMYMVDNQVQGHYETQGNPGFTGVTPQNRAAAVGYPYGAGEEITGLNTNAGGVVSVIRLASLPYHVADLFTPYTEVGVQYGPGNASNQYYLFELMIGAGQSTPLLQNAPLTFPCQGTTGVDYEAAGPEGPEPTINGTVYNVSTPVGTPIAIIGNPSDTIALTNATLTDPSGASIALNLLDSADDSNHELPPSAAAVFPTSALQPNTTYMATISGTINGNTFTRQFTFTTGNQGQF